MELIKIYQRNLIDARELWEFLGSKRQFANWIKKRIEECDLIENKDYFTFNKIVKRSRTNEYHLTLTAAKEMAMMERNDKGKQARRYFIQCEETLIQLKENKRFAAFSELEITKQKFKDTLSAKGLSEQDYIEIDTEGKKVLMNGKVLEDQFLETVLMKARDLATHITHYNTVAHELNDSEAIKKENRENHSNVRGNLIEKGIVPENLPEKGDVKKLE
ncbi:MAG: antA/AntB antirepressor family protein [Flammeovirgaceae bacterium]|nr:antA/AntB antirepressor family protein [Flammeovirgaceae bacterium]